MWQTIDSAPKGGGAELVTDPNWVEPPFLLLYCADGSQVVARWDWYYAEGGRGFTDGCAWIEPSSGEPVNCQHDWPTHWQPLPPSPEKL